MTKQIEPRHYEVGDDGKLHAVYRPIVCTTAFGANEYFECLKLFLTSLVEFGHYFGDVAVFTERSADDIKEFLPEFMLPRIYIKHLTELSHCAKYTVADAGLERYSPILYVDNDIIVNRDINPILSAISMDRGICVTTEEEHYSDLRSTTIGEVRDVRRVGNWFGLEMLQSDPDCAGEVLPLVNGGILGFSDIGNFKILTELIRNLFHHPCNINLEKYFGDQPFLNYVLVKTKLGSYEPLHDTCTFSGTWLPAPDTRRGFMHFVWARGEDKSRQMRLYLNHMRGISPDG
jgi:hypothetical protein